MDNGSISNLWMVSHSLTSHRWAMGHIWGLWCQKQVSQAGISNCIPQYWVRYFAEFQTFEIPPKYLIHYCGMQLLIHAWDTCFWYQSLHIMCEYQWLFMSFSSLWMSCGKMSWVVRTVLTAQYQILKVHWNIKLYLYSISTLRWLSICI